MHRIDTENAVASLPAPSAPGALVGYFSDGETISGTPGTVISANWLNAVQEELVAVMSEGGVTPDKATNDQLLDAIIAIIEERSIDSVIDGVENKLLRTDGSERTPVVSSATELDASDNLGGLSSVAIGASISGKDGSAILEATSSTKGFLPPRMTETQRDAIAAPAEGLVVYNTTQKRHDFHNGLAWGAVAGSAVPVGGIIAFSGGYFTDAANGGFTSVLGNSVASVNSALNGSGWYVCDGSALNLPGSPIFNGAGRYLANLSDDRFLMGSTAAGSTGGQNSVTLLTANLPSHTHDLAHSHGTHTHSITHDHTLFNSVGAGGHTHGVYKDGGSNAGQAFKWTDGNVRSTTISTDSEANHTHQIDVPSISATSGPETVSLASGTASGSTGSGTAYENRPLYLSVLYLQRAI